MLFDYLIGLFLSFFFLLGCFAMLSPINDKKIWETWVWYKKHPMLAIGFAFIGGDILWNILGATILYHQLPYWDKDQTVTHRTNRILREDPMDTLRWRIAVFIALTLNNISPGHCKGYKQRMEKEGIASSTV